MKQASWARLFSGFHSLPGVVSVFARSVFYPLGLQCVYLGLCFCREVEGRGLGFWWTSSCIEVRIAPSDSRNHVEYTTSSHKTATGALLLHLKMSWLALAGDLILVLWIKNNTLKRKPFPHFQWKKKRNICWKVVGHRFSIYSLKCL